MTTDQEYAELFLGYYGYAPGAAGLRDFQERAGLFVTGLADEDTLRLMRRPRCGVSDALRATAEARWRRNRLSYYVESYLPVIDRAVQDDIFRAAWRSWESVADVRFSQVGSAAEANIVISTGRGQRAGFDGPSGTLAWAQLPPGDDRPLLMRFDVDERWQVSDPRAGILLLHVAAHEFGHLLGLDHSQAKSALMAPFYSPSVGAPQQNDDIPRIRSYYGPAAGAPDPKPDPKPTPGGSMSKELVRAIVKIAIGAFASYAASTTKGLMGVLDDYAAKWLQANEDKIVDLILARFGGAATITEADIAVALADIRAEALAA